MIENIHEPLTPKDFIFRMFSPLWHEQIRAECPDSFQYLFNHEPFARLCRFYRSTSGRLLPTGRKKASRLKEPLIMNQK